MRMVNSEILNFLADDSILIVITLLMKKMQKFIQIFVSRHDNFEGVHHIIYLEM
jgi:hypothetical protein